MKNVTKVKDLMGYTCLEYADLLDDMQDEFSIYLHDNGLMEYLDNNPNEIVPQIYVKYFLALSAYLTCLHRFNITGDFYPPFIQIGGDFYVSLSKATNGKIHPLSPLFYIKFGGKVVGGDLYLPSRTIAHIACNENEYNSESMYNLGRSQRNWKTYIMEDGATGVYKIGKSCDPENRLSQLETGNPKIQLMAYIEGDFERELHLLFEERRKVGEWFSLQPDDLCEFASKYGKYLVWFNRRFVKKFLAN